MYVCDASHKAAAGFCSLKILGKEKSWVDSMEFLNDSIMPEEEKNAILIKESVWLWMEFKILLRDQKNALQTQQRVSLKNLSVYH